MTLSDLVQYIQLKLGEQTAFYPEDEVVRGGINVAQRWLCRFYPRLLRQRLTHTVTTDLPFIDLRTVLDGSGVRAGNRIRKVRRVMIGDVSGDAPTRNAATSELRELRRASLMRLAHRQGWMREKGKIDYYWLWGEYWMGLYRRPIDTTTVTVIFDAVPVPLVNDTDTPDVQASVHRDIAEIAAGLLLAKEGAPDGVRGIIKATEAVGLRLRG